MTQITDANAYSIAVGSSSTSAFVTYFSTVAPLSSNNRFPVGKRWVNISTGSEYILSPTYQWIMLTTADANLNTFTGNSGGPVSPDFGNINIDGDVNTAVSVGTSGSSILQTSVVLPVVAHSVLDKSSSGIGGISPSSTSGLPVVSQGSSSDASFSSMAVAGGGTGNTSQEPYSLVAAGVSSTSAFQAVSPISSTNAPLVATGSSSLPSFSDTADVYASSISFDNGAFSLSIYKNKETWTPSLRFGGSSTTTYSIQNGIYSRFNQVVFIHFELQIATLPVQSGTATLAGVPALIGPGTTSFLQLYYENLTLPVATTDVLMRIAPAPIVTFLAVGSSGSLTVLDFSNFTSSTYLSVTALYTF